MSGSGKRDIEANAPTPVQQFARKGNATVLSRLDNWMPYRLWVPPIIFLFAFWCCALPDPPTMNVTMSQCHNVTGAAYSSTTPTRPHAPSTTTYTSLAPHTHSLTRRVVQAIMPDDFVASNLHQSALNVPMRLVAWFCIWWLAFEMIRGLFFVFGIISARSAPAMLRNAITGTDLKSRATWCVLMIAWVVSEHPPRQPRIRWCGYWTAMVRWGSTGPFGMGSWQ